jgi:excisionase family DNA binding protein
MSKADILEAEDIGLSKKETAQLFNCSERSVDRLVADGELPFVQVSPRRIIILRSDVREYLRTRRQWRTPPALEPSVLSHSPTQEPAHT